MAYKREFIDRVKKAYPESERIHALADSGDEFLGQYLRDGVVGMHFYEVLAADSLETMKEKALAMKEKNELYLDFVAGDCYEGAPCKVGDALWADMGVGEVSIEPLTVHSIAFKGDDFSVRLSHNGVLRQIRSMDIGQKAFYSKEEAEAALCQSVSDINVLIAQAAEKCSEMSKDTYGKVVDFGKG